MHSEFLAEHGVILGDTRIRGFQREFDPCENREIAAAIVAIRAFASSLILAGPFRPPSFPAPKDSA